MVGKEKMKAAGRTRAVIRRGEEMEKKTKRFFFLNSNWINEIYF